MDSCPNCASVHFVERRVHRNGSLTVALGHFLLAPSILAVVLASMGVISRPSRTTDASRQAAIELEAVGVPAPVADHVASHEPLSDSELGALSEEQQQSVLRAQIRVANGNARASMSRFASGRTLFLLASLSAAGGVLGWLLVRKTRVAQCVNCGSSTAPELGAAH